VADDLYVEERQQATSPGSGERSRLQRHFWIVRRLLVGVLVVFSVSLIVFAATQAIPGDPVHRILGSSATEEQIQVLREQLGLDRSLVHQYLSWSGGLLSGDLGTTLTAGTPVSDAIGPRLVNTSILMLVTGMLMVPLSIIIGGAAAVKRDRALDNTFVYGSLAFIATPPFVVGTLLIILLSTTVWRVLPSVALIPPGESPLRHPDMLVLPVLTLLTASVPYLGRFVRASLVEVLDSEYIQMARLKGVPDRILLRRHALPNALASFVQATALMLAYLVGGAVVVEYLFNYPGIGSMFVDAVAQHDISVVQAVALIFSAAYVLLNLLADIFSVYLTPRLRTAL
jgi:peptide/nickel transport system permease protein